MLNDLKSPIEPWSQSASMEEVEVPVEEASQLGIDVYEEKDKYQIKETLDLWLFMWVQLI